MHLHCPRSESVESSLVFSSFFESRRTSTGKLWANADLPTSVFLSPAFFRWKNVLDVICLLGVFRTLISCILRATITTKICRRRVCWIDTMQWLNKVLVPLGRAGACGSQEYVYTGSEQVRREYFWIENIRYGSTWEDSLDVYSYQQEILAGKICQWEISAYVKLWN